MGKLDVALLRALRTRLHEPPVEGAVRRFSAVGEHGGIWLAISLAGAAATPARRSAFRRSAITVITSYLANQAVKLAVRRPRPKLADLPPLISTHSDRSYPSAHATTSFAGARALSALLPAPPLYVLAVALAVSRPYLGVHYPSDTLAGATLGLAVAELAR